MMNSELFLKDNVTPGGRTASKRAPEALDYALDQIRLLAIVFVVLTHTSAQWLDRACSDSGAARFFTQLCSIASFAGVSLFVMLSGALFLAPSHREKSCSVRRMSRRSLHYFLLYFLWKAFYLLEDGLLYPEVLHSKGIKDGLILAFFRLSGKYHLWYLPMLCVLLLLVPLLYEGAQHLPACLLYLSLSFLCAVLLPTAFLFDFPFKYLLLDFRDLFDLNYFLGYLGYFLLGHVLYEHSQGEVLSPSGAVPSADIHRRSRKNALLAALWLLAFVALFSFAATASSRSAGQTQADTSFASPFSLAVCLLSSALFLTLCRSTSHAHESFLSSALSCAVFGVYLLHPFFLDLLSKAGILVQISNPFVGIPFLLALLLVLSFASSLLMNRMPLLRRLVS